jgi:hypothetical protein
MVNPPKRRRRKPEEIAKAPPAPKARRRAVKVKSKSNLRDIYRIALSLFEAKDMLGSTKHKAIVPFRMLFCLAKVDDVANQWGENAVLIRTWTGAQAITEWVKLSGTGRDSKAVKLLRSELEQHLKEAA